MRYTASTMSNRQSRNENDVKKKGKGAYGRAHALHLSTLKPYDNSISYNIESHSSNKLDEEGKFSHQQPTSKTPELVQVHFLGQQQLFISYLLW